MKYSREASSVCKLGGLRGQFKGNTFNLLPKLVRDLTSQTKVATTVDPPRVCNGATVLRTATPASARIA